MTYLINHDQVYTFLATLVLLLAVSGAIVIRSFVLRRRHRLMVEEAIRNGTWVPPTAPTRPPRVDLSKTPTLWEAYLSDGAWHVKGLGQEGMGWKFEGSKDWESIKPVCADYTGALTFPNSNSTTNLSPPNPVPVPTPTATLIPPAPRGDEENQRTAEVSTTPSLLSRARMLLNPTPLPTSPLPPSSASPDNANTHPTAMSTVDPSSPTTMRVAVLIAMPSPLHSSHGSSSALSGSFSSLSSNSYVPQPTTSHPLQLSPSPTISAADAGEHSLPHLEMGIAEVAIGPSENSTTWNNTRQGKTNSRGSSYTEP